MPHDVFISYSRRDRDFAVRLQKTLASYVPPRSLPLPRRRLDVFRDEQDFTGAEYYQSLERHLRGSGKLIVLCSPAARGSQFVNDEIRRFASTKGAENIIALLVAGIPNNEATPTQHAEMAFPDALCEALQMPLAADYRGFDGQRSKVDRGAFEASWYTTLANIYDVSRAQIEEREKKRRARRRTIALGLTAASVSVLAGLSLLAWQQRQDAIRQEHLAAARSLAGRAVASESMSLRQGLRIRALIAAESLREAWTDEGYDAWRRATLEMPPVLGSIATDSVLIRMAFTSDATKLLALCGERHIHVFSVPDLQELHIYAASETAFELAVDARGEQALAFQADDEFIEAFDIASGASRSVLLPAAFRLAAFNAAGDALLASLTHLWVLDGASDEVASRVLFPKFTSAVALSPDGATALALTDGALIAYDTRDGAVRWQVRPSGEDAGREVIFSGDGSAVLLAGARELMIVNTATGEAVESIPATEEPGGRPMLLSADFYLVGNDLYAVNGEVERILPFAVEPSSPSRLPVANPSGRYIAGIQSGDQNFIVVDTAFEVQSLADDGVAFYLTLDEGHQGTAAAFTADGNLLAASSREAGYGRAPGRLQLVSLQPQRWRPIVPATSRTGDLSVLPPDAQVVARHREFPSPRTFDADGTPAEHDLGGLLVSASGRLAARLEPKKQWVITDTRTERSITVADNGSPIEFSPDEQRVLVFPEIFTLNDQTPPQTIAGAEPLFKTWSFPGSTLVIGIEAQNASRSDATESVLFDWHTGTIATGPGSAESIYAVSPDGRRFATYERESIAIWKVGDDGPEVRSDRAVLDYDTPLHFSPNGTLLAVAACGSPRLYDARTLELRFRVPMNGCFAGFTLDGKHLVSHRWRSGYPEPTLHPITLEGVLAETCAKVHDDLTPRDSARLGISAMNTCPDRGAVSGGGAPASTE